MNTYLQFFLEKIKKAPRLSVVIIFSIFLMLGASAEFKSTRVRFNYNIAPVVKTIASLAPAAAGSGLLSFNFNNQTTNNGEIKEKEQTA